MAIHKCYCFSLKWKNLLSPTPDACSPLLALSVFTGASRLLQQGEVKDSYLAWVRPVVLTCPASGLSISFTFSRPDWGNSQDRLLIYELILTIHFDISGSSY